MNHHGQREEKGRETQSQQNQGEEVWILKICTMSSTATATVISSFSTSPALNRTSTTTFAANFTSRNFPATKLSSNNHLLFFKLPHTSKRSPISRRFNRFSPVMEWQDCTVKREVDVPVSVAYACYSDREAISEWMPFISTVKILPDKPDLSRWSLKYTAFGQNLEFSWLSRNMQPTPNQKIHWRSLEGLPNRGAVRFFPKGPSSCVVELTVSYEIPQLLAPVASALKPFLEGLLQRGLENFASFAKSYK